MEEANGLRLTFLADLNPVRAAVDQFAQEVAGKPIVVQVRAAGATGSGRGALGSLAGTDPAAMVNEDRRIEQRMLTAGESSARVERLIDRTDSGATPVVARRLIDIPGVPPTWGNYAGWGGGAGAPPYLPGAAGYGGGAYDGGGGGGGGQLALRWPGGGAAGAGGGGYGGGGAAGGYGGWNWRGGGGGGFTGGSGPLALSWPGGGAGGGGPNIPGGFPGVDIPNGAGGGADADVAGGGALSFLAMRHVMRAAMASVEQLRKYNMAMIEAGGDPQKEAAATIAGAESRFFGISALAEDPTGVGYGHVHRTMMDAEAQDKAGELREHASDWRRAFGAESKVIQARGSLAHDFAQIEAKTLETGDRIRLMRTKEQGLENERHQQISKGIDSDDWMKQQIEDRGQEYYDALKSGKTQGQIEGEWRGTARTAETNVATVRNATIKTRYDAEDDVNRQNAAAERRMVMMGEGEKVATATLRGEYYNLKAQGRDDEAEHLLQKGMGDIAINYGFDSPSLLGAKVRENAAALAAGDAERGRSGELRRDQLSAIIANAPAAYGNDVPGQMAKLGADVWKMIAEAQAKDKPLAILAGGVAYNNGVLAINRHDQGSVIGAEGEAAASGYLAVGDTAEARRVRVKSNLRERLLAEGGEGDDVDDKLRAATDRGEDGAANALRRRAAARANATNEDRIIDRDESLRTERLKHEVDESSALAMGTRRGGYQDTYRERVLIDRIKEAADAESDPEKKAMILQRGVYQARALQRDQNTGGSGEEFTPNTIGPGVAPSGDEQQANNELLQAIKELTAALNESKASAMASQAVNSEAEQIAAYPF